MVCGGGTPSVGREGHEGRKGRGGRQDRGKLDGGCVFWIELGTHVNEGERRTLANRARASTEHAEQRRFRQEA